MRAVFRYRHPVPALVHAFKYRGSLSAGRALGAWMGEAWPLFPELGAPDALVPVPLHPARLRLRGFNQALELARGVSAAAGVPVLEALRRGKNAPPRARRRRDVRPPDLAGEFRLGLGAEAEVSGKRLVLVDDVFTTGGTLAGCALTLRAAGAAEVSAYVLAVS